MPKNRVPSETWNKIIRPIIWNRDQGKCQRCNIEVSLNKCHIDHIISGKRGSNKIKNLRTLCKRCHVLRKDMNHRGMTASALKNKLIPSNWRNSVW
ncbi:HNH endonuclease [Sutcliffiella horikoshii]|uniref:HNH endonuclease n=1 Tax=Sutcliffiella horikoshii TaxID=79883 RepID=A0A5D4T9L9_9BACI|nr:HNH endonuclease signature motif containing protein [Sutcliffiella horikoshii]TYS72413.1 HNH endonuclease [Sutcliffiella horikoshii]